MIDRIAIWVRAAQLASRMRATRVGRIAEPFVGMGDFAVPSDVLRKTIGVQTVPADYALLQISICGDGTFAYDDVSVVLHCYDT